MRKAALAILFILFVIASCSKKSTPAGTANAATSGASIFSKNCARCHGSQGIKDSRTPNLQTIELAKDGLIKSITNGKITEGKKEHMPAFKDKLSTAQISALADLIVSWHQK